MGFSNKAWIAVAIGAVLGLKDQVIKPKSRALTGSSTVVIGSLANVRFLSSGGDVERKKKQNSDERRRQAAEESLRMVVFLSCWGPN